MFDEIFAWCELPEDELATLISAEKIEKLQSAIALLNDQTKFPMAVDRQNFISLLKEMNKRRREGSRALGSAIIEASRYLDSGNVEEARQIYRRFLAICSFPFYRSIAEYQLQRIKTKSGTD